ncbi:unnamed protein product [Parajaminaea phylloscopi]
MLCDTGPRAGQLDPGAKTVFWRPSTPSNHRSFKYNWSLAICCGQQNSAQPCGIEVKMSSFSTGSTKSAAATDQTVAFKTLVTASQRTSSSGTGGNPHRPPSKAKAAELWHIRRKAERDWNQEAQRLFSAIESLHHFLSAIKRAYLHLGGPSRRFNDLQTPREFGKSVDSDEMQHGTDAAAVSNNSEGLYAYKNLDYLTEAQKDEIDSHLKLALSRSVDRLKELMKAEQMRQHAQPAPSSTTLARLLAPPLPASSLDSLEYSAQLAQHRDSITSRLGARLKRAGERLGLMQEARVAALEEQRGARRALAGRSRTSAQGVTDRSSSSQARSGALAGSTASFSASAQTTHATHLHSEGQPAAPAEQLTQEQEQLFASESSALAKTLESDLAAVDAVSRTLATISDLQTTLISHLSQQNETIANLGNEALDQRIEVQKGNDQLKRAKERNRSANRLLGALLVGSGLGLLFLHVMD